MTVDELLNSLENPVIHEGASYAAITCLDRVFEGKAPQTYRELMGRTNGVEGFLSEVNYLVVWPVDTVAEMNEGYGVKFALPGIVLFGSNGGDAGYGFDTRVNPVTIVEVPFIGMKPEEAKVVGTSFEAFVRNLQRE